MFGLFKKFKSGFARTTQSLFGAVGGIFGGKQLDADSIDALEEALYGADFGVETTEEIIEEIQASFKADKSLRGLDAAEIGASVLRRVLEGARAQPKGWPRTALCTRYDRGSCNRQLSGNRPGFDFVTFKSQTLHVFIHIIMQEYRMKEEYVCVDGQGTYPPPSIQCAHRRA